MSLGNWEDWKREDAKSGELPVSYYRLTYERWGRWHIPEGRLLVPMRVQAFLLLADCPSVSHTSLPG